MDKHHIRNRPVFDLARFLNRSGLGSQESTKLSDACAKFVLILLYVFVIRSVSLNWNTWIGIRVYSVVGHATAMTWYSTRYVYFSTFFSLFHICIAQLCS